MEVSVLALRDLASGRPGRRGRAEAAQKVSGRAKRAGGAGRPLGLRLSRCGASRRPGRGAKVRGCVRDCGGFGRPAGQTELARPVRAGVRSPGPGGLGGASSRVGRPGVCPGSCPSHSRWERLGCCPLDHAPGLSCHVGLYSSILPVSMWSRKGLKDNPVKELWVTPLFSVSEVIALCHYSQGNSF